MLFLGCCQFLLLSTLGVLYSPEDNLVSAKLWLANASENQLKAPAHLRVCRKGPRLETFVPLCQG